MDFMSLFDLVILPAIALLSGRFLKTAPWFNTKFVPIGNLALVILVKIVTALGLTVASANASEFAIVGVIGAFGWKGFLWEAAKAIMAVLLATGTHSAVKNAKEGLK